MAGPMIEEKARYDAVAIALHWLIAAGVVALVAIGLAMVNLKLAPLATFQLYQLHKSIGVTVLLAAGVRLCWRLTHRPPPLPQAMPEAERRAAAAAHVALYALLILLPLSGWALVSASPLNIQTVLYGVLPWPHLPALPDLADKAPVEAALKSLHHLLAFALVALIAIHASAALRHQFILRDGMLWRMLPLGRRPAARDPK